MSTEEERAKKAAYMREWLNKNKDKVNAKRRERRNKNIEESRAKAKHYRDTHPEYAKKWNNFWNKKHPDLNRERSRKWFSENPERQREQKRKYRAENRDSINTRIQNWKQANPDKVKVAHEKRRAAKMNADGTLTPQEWRNLCDRYENTCLRCKRKDVKLTMDHVVPLSLGGRHSIENIQPLCQSCNSAKKDKSIDYR